MYKHRELFRTMVVVGLVAAVAKCFRHRAWKMAGAPEGEFPSKHWHKFHSHRPPWFKDWKEPSAEETEQVEAAAETATVQA